MDLVTEGILTLTRVLDYLENPPSGERLDAAARLAALFKENDCISFMVGAKMNQAYYDPEWPVELEIRQDRNQTDSQASEDKYLKNIEIEFV